jgi:hypothetical protein
VGTETYRADTTENPATTPQTTAADSMVSHRRRHLNAEYASENNNLTFILY